jgi:hypothetical protein
MKNNPIFITREQHDSLLVSDNTLLRDMFRYEHSWSIGGVTFFGMCCEYMHCVRQSIKYAPK